MRPLREYLRTRDGVFAVSLVLASGLALAFFTWRTFVDRPPRDYWLDFGRARWIQHDGESPCAYFRKTIYVSGNVQRGWIEISATDHFVLYVNGIVVKNDLFAGVRPAGIFDLKHLLRNGKNVIAVYVPRIYYPGNAQLLVRGFYATQTAPLTEFRSDAGWKVSKTPDGIVGGYNWFDPLLDDTLWANAFEAASGEVFPTIQPVGIDPKIFEIRPAAVWLGPKISGALDATFESGERLPLIRGATWLQVAATGSYDVIINDRLALSQARPQQTKLPFAEPSPAPSPARVPSANIGSVTPQPFSAPSPARVPSVNIGSVTPQPSPSPSPAQVPSAPVMSQHGVRKNIGSVTQQPFSAPSPAHVPSANIGAVTPQRSAA